MVRAGAEALTQTSSRSMARRRFFSVLASIASRSAFFTMYSV